MHSLRGAKELFWQLPGSCLPPQAQHFLGQPFLSRGFPPARGDLSGFGHCFVDSPVTLETVPKVCVSIPASWLSLLWRCAPAVSLLDRAMHHKVMWPCTSVVPNTASRRGAGGRGDGNMENGMGRPSFWQTTRVKGEESSPCSLRLMWWQKGGPGLWAIQLSDPSLTNLRICGRTS